MTLFFETMHQAVCFLAAVPLGMLAAAGLSAGKAKGAVRLMLDLIILAVCGVMQLALVVVLRDSALRMYHVTGALCGAILYLCGVDKLRKGAECYIRKRKTEKK